jgi:FKBP-type peptidyl-prolyl cis-trans isomerase FkpA
MKKIKSVMFSAAVLVAACGLMSCKKTKTTSDGIEYTYVKEGKEAPKNGEFVLYHLIVQNDKDSTFISTYDQNMPGYLQFYDSLPKQSGMDEIFLNLKKGDSIAFEATAEKIFKENVPFFLKADQNVKVRIGVIEVLDQQGVEAYFSQMQEAEERRMAENSTKQMEMDIKVIEDYISANNINANRTESGLFYVIEENGSGPAIEPGDMAFVHYAGYLLDGTLFDTSRKELAQAQGVFNEQRDIMGGYGPLDVMVGQGRVIQGWDEGLGLLKKGDKAKFIIPSPLAYGDRAAGAAIPANSILIFDVEVTDVQK